MFLSALLFCMGLGFRASGFFKNHTTRPGRALGLRVKAFGVYGLGFKLKVSGEGLGVRGFGIQGLSL